MAETLADVLARYPKDQWREAKREFWGLTLELEAIVRHNIIYSRRRENPELYAQSTDVEIYEHIFHHKPFAYHAAVENARWYIACRSEVGL